MANVGNNNFQVDKTDVFVGKTVARKTTSNPYPSSTGITRSPLDKKDDVGIASKPKLNPENPFSNEPVYMSDVKYKRHFEGEKPIPNMEVTLRGRSFDDVMYNPSMTTYKIAENALSSEVVANNPDLKEKMLDFAKNLAPKDKEAVMYMKTLVERKPGLSVNDLKEVFTKLDSMMKEPNYDPRIGNKKEMVISALHDIAEPSDISQEGIGTCTATTIQIQLAIRNPKEYLNMIDDLSKNQQHTTIMGKKIDPNWTFTEEGKEGKTDTRRTISAKIMQNAIMDFADANTRNFDSSKADGGLTYDQTSGAINDIMNQNVASYEIWDYSAKQLVDLLKKSNPSDDNPIEISMAYQADGRDAFHSLSAVGLSDNKIQIVNPWGRQESFSLEEFQRRVMSVSAKKDADIGIKSVNSFDPSVVPNLNNDAKRNELLNSMGNKDKINFVADLSGLHFYTNNPTDKNLSATEKKAIQYSLNSLLDSGPAQNERVYQLVLNTVGVQNTTLLLNRINDGSELYNSLKTKMDTLARENQAKASKASNA
ncbi:MAG: hypothetical protein U0457_04455 [Candidatus Sericytochromatia bacterium]